jgi:hypothetical protein
MRLHYRVTRWCTVDNCLQCKAEKSWECMKVYSTRYLQSFNPQLSISWWRTSYGHEEYHLIKSYCIFLYKCFSDMRATQWRILGSRDTQSHALIMIRMTPLRHNVFLRILDYIIRKTTSITSRKKFQEEGILIEPLRNTEKNYFCGTLICLLLGIQLGNCN